MLLQAQICERLGKAAFCTEAWASKQLCLTLFVVQSVVQFGTQCPVLSWRTARTDIFYLTVCNVSRHLTSVLPVSPQQLRILKLMSTACRLLVLTTL